MVLGVLAGLAVAAAVGVRAWWQQRSVPKFQTAKVTRGREAPGAIVRVYSNIIKHENEVRSHQVGSVSCSIRSGNVFAQ